MRLPPPGKGEDQRQAASWDPRFSNNPAVVGPPKVRFYAGRPVSTKDGHRVGVFCILDVQPRELDAEGYGLLRDLAALAEEQLALRPAT